MPFLEIASVTHEIRREDMAIVDTNALYSAFKRGDSRQEDVLAFLDAIGQVIIPMPVVVETWGLLVGSERDWEGGLNLLAWIANPANDVVVIHNYEPVANILALATKLHIDCVDAMIFFLAHRISVECCLEPPCRVATYDTRDFFRLLQYSPLSLVVHDLTTSEDIRLE